MDCNSIIYDVVRTINTDDTSLIIQHVILNIEMYIKKINPSKYGNYRVCMVSRHLLR